jgi:mannose-1-phosphate guanylyltransferase/mannose-6-phosphate isomerase
MERAPNLTVVPYAGAWSDLDDWQAVLCEATGTVTAGPAGAIDCHDTLLQATNET